MPASRLIIITTILKNLLNSLFRIELRSTSKWAVYRAIFIFLMYNYFSSITIIIIIVPIAIIIMLLLLLLLLLLVVVAVSAVLVIVWSLILLLLLLVLSTYQYYFMYHSLFLNSLYVIWFFIFLNPTMEFNNTTFLCYHCDYGCSNVAKLSWKKYIFLRKKYVWFSKNLFFSKKSYLFKINICVSFQKL